MDEFIVRRHFKIDPDRKKSVPNPGITIAAHLEQALTSGEGDYDTQGSATVHRNARQRISGWEQWSGHQIEKDSLNGQDERIGRKLEAKIFVMDQCLLYLPPDTLCFVCCDQEALP